MPDASDQPWTPCAIRVTSALEPGEPEAVVETGRVRLEAPEALLHRVEEVRGVERNADRVLRQEPLELVVDRLAAGGRGRGAARLPRRQAPLCCSTRQILSSPPRTRH